MSIILHQVSKMDTFTFIVNELSSRSRHHRRYHHRHHSFAIGSCRTV